jgi:hypothetical protein
MSCQGCSFIQWTETNYTSELEIPSPMIRQTPIVLSSRNIKELNALGALKLVNICHTDPWILKMHFWPHKLLDGSHNPLNFENTFLAPLNLLGGTPQAHPCHVGIILLTWRCYVAKNIYTELPWNPIRVAFIGTGAASVQRPSPLGRTTREARWGGPMARHRKHNPSL